MTCEKCERGTCTPGVTTITLTRGQTVAMFCDVPAEVCDTCGEAYLSGETAAALQEAMTRMVGDGIRYVVREYRAA